MTLYFHATNIKDPSNERVAEGGTSDPHDSNTGCWLVIISNVFRYLQHDWQRICAQATIRRDSESMMQGQGNWHKIA